MQKSIKSKINEIVKAQIGQSGFKNAVKSSFSCAVCLYKKKVGTNNYIYCGLFRRLPDISEKKVCNFLQRV